MFSKLKSLKKFKSFFFNSKRKKLKFRTYKEVVLKFKPKKNFLSRQKKKNFLKKNWDFKKKFVLRDKIFNRQVFNPKKVLLSRVLLGTFTNDLVRLKIFKRLLVLHVFKRLSFRLLRSLFFFLMNSNSFTTHSICYNRKKITSKIVYDEPSVGYTVNKVGKFLFKHRLLGYLLRKKKYRFFNKSLRNKIKSSLVKKVYFFYKYPFVSRLRFNKKLCYYFKKQNIFGKKNRICYDYRSLYRIKMLLGNRYLKYINKKLLYSQWSPHRLKFKKVILSSCQSYFLSNFRASVTVKETFNSLNLFVSVIDHLKYFLVFNRVKYSFRQFSKIFFLPRKPLNKLPTPVKKKKYLRSKKLDYLNYFRYNRFLSRKNFKLLISGEQNKNLLLCRFSRLWRPKFIFLNGYSKSFLVFNFFLKNSLKLRYVFKNLVLKPVMEYSHLLKFLPSFSFRDSRLTSDGFFFSTYRRLSSNDLKFFKKKVSIKRYWMKFFEFSKTQKLRKLLLAAKNKVNKWSFCASVFNCRLDIVLTKLVFLKGLKIIRKLLTFGHVLVNNIVRKDFGYVVKDLDLLKFSVKSLKWFNFFKRYSVFLTYSSLARKSKSVIYIFSRSYWCEINWRLFSVVMINMNGFYNNEIFSKKNTKLPPFSQVKWFINNFVYI